MADNAWLIVNTLDETTYQIVPTLHAENFMGRIQPYAPSGPDDPRAAVGVLSVITAPNGSQYYTTHPVADLQVAVKAKAV